MFQPQISQLEDEITQDWQTKCDKMVALAEEKHARALKAVMEEKEELEENITQLNNKVGIDISTARLLDHWFMVWPEAGNYLTF